MGKFPFLLINPPVKEARDQYDLADFPNSTLAYLSSFLIKNGKDCRVIDAKLSRMSAEEVLRAPDLFAAGMVGITAMTHEINSAAELAAKIKDKFRNKKIIIGGPHATALPYETLRDCPAFDFLISGEGERPLLNLISAREENRPCDAIKGVSCRHNGNLSINPEEDPLKDIDEISFCSYGLFPPCERYFILTARGCIYRCPFCYHKRSKIRMRSPAKVIEELKVITENFRPKVITFADDTFNADKGRLFEILELMIKHGFSRYSEFKATLHARNLDYQTLNLMRRAGFRIIHLGVESGNEKILKKIGKGISREIVASAVKNAKKAGLAVQGLYIIGHPEETWKEAWDTVKFAVKLNTEEIALAVMVPYPGTEIWKMARENRHGYRNLSQDWEKYSKYFGHPVDFTNFNRLQLFILQLSAYLGLYLCNLRFISLFRFVFSYRTEIAAFFSSRWRALIRERTA